MKSLFVLFFGSIFLYSSAIAQPINEEVSSGTIFDGEPYLVINPTNSDNMIIGWMSTAKGTLAIRVRTTFDGGITWGNEVVMPHSNPTFQSADVSMTFGKNGVVYLEYIDYTRSPHDSGLIVVTHSGDGGKSWDKPIEAFNYYDNTIAPIDRPWMVVDNSGTASDGTIYITTKPVPWNTLPSHPYLKYSTDNGKTWSKIDSVDGGEYPAGIVAAPMVSPAVSSDGVFHAAYASWDVKKNPLPRYTLANSTDKGVSYTRTTIYSPTTGAKGDTLSKVGYRLAANPLNPKNLVFVSLDSRNGDYDVYAFVTTDNGATWSKGERINDDAIGNGIWQDLLWANFSDNGKCVISWRDRRNGDSTGYEQGSDIYFAVSTDNGKSFGKNIRLSDKTAPFAKILNSAGNDFQSTVIIHDSICATWGDTRSGKLSIYFAKAALADGIANVVTVSQDKHHFLVYPNPAKTSVSIKFMLEETEAIALSIFDVSGKEIWTDRTDKTNNYSKTIDLSGFSVGVYTILARTPNGIFSKEFTIVH